MSVLQTESANAITFEVIHIGFQPVTDVSHGLPVNDMRDMPAFAVALLDAHGQLFQGPSVVCGQVHCNATKQLVDVFVSMAHGKKADDDFLEHIHVHQ